MAKPIVVVYLAFMMKDDLGKSGDNFDEKFRSRNGHRIMETIGTTIGTGLGLEFSRDLPLD